MWECKLCEVETVYMTHLCEKCRRIKHLLSLYQSRVYDVLNKVLISSPAREKELVREELKNEIRSQVKKVQESDSSDSD
tara:strand:- start:24 stop:260 length:237 start_codon:yes stop_codon:yes gene_type:complete